MPAMNPDPTAPALPLTIEEALAKAKEEGIELDFECFKIGWDFAEDVAKRVRRELMLKEI